MTSANNTIFVRHKNFSWNASYPFSFHFIFRNTETGYINVFFKYWQSKIITKSTKNTQELKENFSYQVHFTFHTSTENKLIQSQTGAECEEDRHSFLKFSLLWSLGPTLFHQQSQPGDQDNPGLSEFRRKARKTPNGQVDKNEPVRVSLMKKL